MHRADQPAAPAARAPQGSRRTAAIPTRGHRILAAALLAALLSLSWPWAATCQADPWPGREWLRATPESQGLSSRRLIALVDRLDRPELHIDSVLLVRHGRIVQEAVFAPYDANLPHDMRSVTKSVLGTVVGVALAQGRLGGLDQSVMRFFPDQTPRDPRFATMRLEDLLDMRTGLAWREWPYDARSDVYRMHASPDFVRFIMAHPMREPAGLSFNYVGAAPQLLSAILSRVTGGPADAYAQQVLFGPLGIQDAPWRRDPQGDSVGESGLSLKPADLARIGLLYLRQGMWAGHRILPAAWVQRVFAQSRPHSVSTRLGLPPRYSLLWWVDPGVPMALASGRHGQHLVVLPKQDILLVITAKTRDDIAMPLDITELVTRALLPAVLEPGPLRPDPEGAMLLGRRWTQAQAARRPASHPPPAAWLRQIDDVTFRLSDNPQRLTAIRVAMGAGGQARFTMVWRSGLILRREHPFTRPFGIHGDWVRSPVTPYGVFASRGMWTDERTLVIETVLPAAAGMTRLELRFDDARRMTLRVLDSDQATLTLRGERED